MTHFCPVTPFKPSLAVHPGESRLCRQAQTCANAWWLSSAYFHCHLASVDVRCRSVVISQLARCRYAGLDEGRVVRSWSHCCLFEFLSADPQQQETIKTGSRADINSIGNRKVGHGLNFYSLDREIALGSQLARQVERSTKFIDDPRVNEYVNRIGQDVVRNSDARLPFTFKVIDSDEVDAFALPGGFLYVNRGLILRAGGEAELAGILAHEIAHVCARHGTRNSTKNEIALVASMSLIFLGPAGWAGYAIYTGLKVGVPLTFLKFSRIEESEADYLGLQYMFRAGYDPEAFITFFERSGLRDKSGQVRDNVLQPSSYAESNQSNPKGNRDNPPGPRSIHCNDVGI